MVEVSGVPERIYYYGEPGNSVWTSDVNNQDGPPRDSISWTLRNSQNLRSSTNLRTSPKVLSSTNLRSSAVRAASFHEKTSRPGGLYSETSNRDEGLYSEEGRDSVHCEQNKSCGSKIRIENENMNDDARVDNHHQTTTSQEEYILQLEEKCERMAAELRRYKRAASHTSALQAHLRDLQSQLDEAMHVIGRLVSQQILGIPGGKEGKEEATTGTGHDLTSERDSVLVEEMEAVGVELVKTQTLDEDLFPRFTSTEENSRFAESSREFHGHNSQSSPNVMDPLWSDEDPSPGTAKDLRYGDYHSEESLGTSYRSLEVYRSLRLIEDQCYG